MLLFVGSEEGIRGAAEEGGGGIGKRSRSVSLFNLEITLSSNLEISLFAWVNDLGERI